MGLVFDVVHSVYILYHNEYVAECYGFNSIDFLSCHYPFSRIKKPLDAFNPSF